MHGTKRPAVISNDKCVDDLPPQSLMLAADKLNMSVYYLCSIATDGLEKARLYTNEFLNWKNY